MAQPARFKLTYWDMRGLAEPLRALLSYTVGLDNWEDERLPVGPPPNYDKSSWAECKQKSGMLFPNLPFLTDLKSGDHMAQTRTIARHLSRIHGNGELLGRTAEEQARADELTEVVFDDWYAMFDVTYLDDPRNALFERECHQQPGTDSCVSEKSPRFTQLHRQYCTKDLPQKLERWDQALKQRKGAFLLGTQLSYADFFLMELVESNLALCTKFGTSLENHGFADLQLMRESMLAIPAISEYRASEKFTFEPFHNNYSHFHWVPK